MAIVGFSFSKILVERKAPIHKAIVNSKIDINDVAKEEYEIEKGKQTLKIDFGYLITYSPDLAVIEFKGHVLFLAEPKDAEIILKEWKKTGKIAKDFHMNLFNYIFQKCNIKALELGDEFNLPLHIQLPTIQISDKPIEKK